MTRQATLETFDAADPSPDEFPIYRFGCRNCRSTFTDADAGVDCPECGRKHPVNFGFLGDVELARAVESIVGAGAQRLDAATAVDVLEQAGEPLPDVVPRGESS